MNREVNEYVFFFGGIYSQWANSLIKEGDLKFNCAEQYMMYYKAILFGDLYNAEEIMKSSDPSEQKSIGRRIKGFNQDKWDIFKYQIVYWGNYLKFTQNSYFAKILLEDHKDKIIVEGSPTDKIWGVGIDWLDPRIDDPKNWQGENLLGKAIMDVRDTLLKEKNNEYNKNTEQKKYDYTAFRKVD